MVTHLEPDILEWEVKGALGSVTMNKASGGDGIPAELFQILKEDDAVCESSAFIKPANMENSSVATGLKKVFLFQSQRKAMPKNVQITVQLHSFHMPLRFCSKSFKLDFSSMWTKNFQMYKLDLENAEEPEIKLPAYAGS